MLPVEGIDPLRPYGSAHAFFFAFSVEGEVLNAWRMITKVALDELIKHYEEVFAP